jgi:hypothetical protein
MKKFADFANDITLDGDKIKIDDVLDKEVVVLNFRIRESKYNERIDSKCLTIQMEIDGKRRIIFSGSEVLSSQLKEYEHELPFLTTIKKIGKYYKLT